MLRKRASTRIILRILSTAISIVLTLRLSTLTTLEELAIKLSVNSLVLELVRARLRNIIGLDRLRKVEARGLVGAR
jgi:hypothetical protein